MNWVLSVDYMSQKKRVRLIERENFVELVKISQELVELVKSWLN